MRIVMNQVTKSFKKQNIIKELNLEMSENEIFGLVGPSGAGKTTMIRLIVGHASKQILNFL